MGAWAVARKRAGYRVALGVAVALGAVAAVVAVSGAGPGLVPGHGRVIRL